MLQSALEIAVSPGVCGRNSGELGAANGSYTLEGLCGSSPLGDAADTERRGGGCITPDFGGDPPVLWGRTDVDAVDALLVGEERALLLPLSFEAIWLSTCAKKRILN
jgi:hypothetical protein